MYNYFSFTIYIFQTNLNEKILTMHYIYYILGFEERSCKLM